MATLKPPNLLVILGDTKKHPGVETRSRVTEQLMKCLQEDRYTVYDITLSEFTQSRWTESTQVLNSITDQRRTGKTIPKSDIECERLLSQRREDIEHAFAD